MDNLELLFSLTYDEWTLYSIRRLNESESQPDFKRQEVVRQITLEHQFRTAINTLIDNDIVDNFITIDNEIIDLDEIIDFLDTY
tara:strand:+ start:224 stop:475 length:252 start_codon:yes stop_codon:yes gene_type:complete